MQKTKKVFVLTFHTRKRINPVSGGDTVIGIYESEKQAKELLEKLSEKHNCKDKMKEIEKMYKGEDGKYFSILEQELWLS